MADHSLTLGALLLTESMPDDDHDFVFNVIAEGATFGDADPVRQVILSLLADGDLVRTTRFGNREVSFAVEITGPDLASVAHGEAALRREIGRGNLLTWQAPDVFAVPTVFEVVDSSMSATFNDLDERMRRLRTFRVTLTCAPFARSVDLVTVDALPVGTTTVLIDNCNTEGPAWTATRNGAPDVATNYWEAGSIGVAELDAVVGIPPEAWSLTRTGSVDFTTTRFLVAELRVIGTVGLSVAGVSATASTGRLPVISIRKVDSGYSEVIFDALGVGVVASLTFSVTTDGTGQAWQGMFIRQVSRTDVPPSITARQQSRIFDIAGTERAQGAIHVASRDANPLYLTLVHTSPEDGSGYAPPLRRWRVSGNAVDPDTFTFSGGKEDLGPAAFSAQVPTSALPEGTYLLMAAMRCAAVTTRRVYWSTSTVFPGSSAFDGVVGGSTDIEFPAAFTWIAASIAVLTLPSVRTVGGKVEVSLRTDETDVTLDEGFLFRAGSDCALSITDSGTKNLWLDSPSLASPVPTIWVGDAADRSDSHHPGSRLIAMGRHTFAPDKTSVYVGANGTAYPAVTLTYHPRWHSNAAE